MFGFGFLKRLARYTIDRGPHPLARVGKYHKFECVMHVMFATESATKEPR